MNRIKYNFKTTLFSFFTLVILSFYSLDTFAQTDPLVIDPNGNSIFSGNVGIGTTTPTTLFQINTDSSPFATSILGKGNDANFKIISYQDRSSNLSGAIIGGFGLDYKAGTKNAMIKFHRGGGETGGFMSFTTNNNSERMRIGSNGNVGIGTTSLSTYKLNVDGSGFFKTLSIGAASSPGTKFKISNSATDFANFKFSGSNSGELEIIGWTSGWNINTKTIGKNLHINRDSPKDNDIYIGRYQHELIIDGETGDITYKGKMNGQDQPMDFYVGNNSQSTSWGVKNIDLQKLCGDADGCTIKIFMQHKLTDQTLTISEHMYIEQGLMSRNKVAGLHGYTRQEGGGESSFILLTSGKYDLIPHPWDWIYLRNYDSPSNGRAFLGFTAQFYVHSHVAAHIIIYDN